jgi:predicted enzyme related to lactoylglutathione lyase
VLETDDLEGDVQRLTGLGLSIPNGIEDAPWGRYIQLEDPDGNGLILQATAANA